jgi:hypothetical protein
MVNYACLDDKWIIEDIRESLTQESQYQISANWGVTSTMNLEGPSEIFHSIIAKVSQLFEGSLFDIKFSKKI